MPSEEYYRFPRPAKLYGFGPRPGTNQDCFLLWLVTGTGDRGHVSRERFDLGFADSSLCTRTRVLIKTLQNLLRYE